MHFVPTSSSWLNMVERWFRDLTGKRLRRGSFSSVSELISAIEAYIGPQQLRTHALRVDQDRRADHREGATWQGGS
jgi:3-methyladenine DNA glycosylase Mpg